MKSMRCFSCGGELPDVDGPVHAYMASTPGCWDTYGEVPAREYGNPSLQPVHRLTDDAYAVQHAGATDRRSIQSVGLHLVRLCLFLDHDLAPEQANDAMLEAGKRKSTITWLEPPQSMGAITAADLHRTESVDEHLTMVRAWAKGSWEAWSRHHETVRTWPPDRWKAPARADARAPFKIRPRKLPGACDRGEFHQGCALEGRTSLIPQEASCQA